MMRATAVLLLAAPMLLGGCAALQPAQPPSPNVYVLAARPLARGTQQARDLVLQVGEPRAWPGFDTDQMIYVQRPYELNAFAVNRWADAPSRMLAPLLTRALEQTGNFKAVVQAPGNVPADVRVDVDLIRLQQDFTTRPSRVELSLRLQLVDLRTRRVLATKTFDEMQEAPSDEPYGGVTAANAALQRVLEEAVDFCARESESITPRRP